MDNNNTQNEDFTNLNNNSYSFIVKSIQKISIIRFKQNNIDGKKFIDYEILIRLSNNLLGAHFHSKDLAVVVDRRYSEFYVFNNDIIQHLKFNKHTFNMEFINCLKKMFPSKHKSVLKLQAFNNIELINERINKLNLYLNKLTDFLQISLKNNNDKKEISRFFEKECELLVKFLNIDNVLIKLTSNNTTNKEINKKEIEDIKQKIKEISLLINANTASNQLNTTNKYKIKDIIRNVECRLRSSLQTNSNNDVDVFDKVNRNNIIANLLEEIKSIKAALNIDDSTSTNNRDRLIFGRNNINNLNTSYKKGKENKETKQLETNEILTLQTNKIKQQDKTLDEMINILKAQKSIANIINKELIVHNEILNNLDNEVDQTKSAITKNISKVKRFI